VERQEAIANICCLNNEQLEAFDHITIDSVQHDAGTLFFLNGPGGTGKTFVYKTVCHHIRAEGRIILCVASSGISALLM